ncbi:hypothetical protein PCC7424_3887 [Gloeothece citriformis PCC 7424]|uniref:Uncharacterized protein n=1 Tax=Gloeothece citriformis (strain PCC 7424) TaxID=65393 RepID=B7KKD3_GLOC7|nr:hypothetical protein [Gloeothece citriformis]ACK72266.1 hypothetical protein PCC7424_3887 [Gloeothece citriformis PCC 7424]
MKSKIGGLIPLVLRKSSLLSALRTLTECGLFYGGLILLRYFEIAPWELFLLSVASASIMASLISRFKVCQQERTVWELGKRSLFISSAILFLFGWWLWRWWHLAYILFKTGLAIFGVSIILFLQYLERELTPQVAVSFLSRVAFIPFPIVLSILFNFLIP